MKSLCGWCEDKLKPNHDYETFGTMCGQCNSEVEKTVKVGPESRPFMRAAGALGQARRLEGNGRPEAYEDLRDMTVDECLDFFGSESDTEDRAKYKRSIEADLVKEEKRVMKMQKEGSIDKFICVKCDFLTKRNSPNAKKKSVLSPV